MGKEQFYREFKQRKTKTLVNHSAKSFFFSVNFLSHSWVELVDIMGGDFTVFHT